MTGDGFLLTRILLPIFCQIASQKCQNFCFVIESLMRLGGITPYEVLNNLKLNSVPRVQYFTAAFKKKLHKTLGTSCVQFQYNPLVPRIPALLPGLVGQSRNRDQYLPPSHFRLQRTGLESDCKHSWKHYSTPC